MPIDSTLPGFRSLTPSQRLEVIALKAGLTPAEMASIHTPGALPLGTADGMIENVIGTY